MSNQQTVMEVKGGKLMPCSNQPISMYQGFEVVESAETTLPDVTESVHQLPAGLRQRFVPIGNGLGESLDDKAKELILSTKKSAGTQRKRKSMKAARKLEDAVASAPTRHNSAKRTASQRDSSDSDETQELPVKRIKKSSSKTSGKSSVDVSPLKPKKEKKAKL
ncbi:hypothetical protein EB796_015087 [Bugula neritina]|uniref:Uncharacterized protein n=1 Tax=Bugula neritina TaxID=10212 RepID=A0A7J7JLS4_BUGNE|nr:hypothetical protein EB796_015087 [Bugula neritina]